MIGYIDYLNTEYARQKDIECYQIEAREKEKAIDDGLVSEDGECGCFGAAVRSPAHQRRENGKG